MDVESKTARRFPGFRGSRRFAVCAFCLGVSLTLCIFYDILIVSLPPDPYVQATVRPRPRIDPYLLVAPHSPNSGKPDRRTNEDSGNSHVQFRLFDSQSGSNVSGEQAVFADPHSRSEATIPFDVDPGTGELRIRRDALERARWRVTVRVRGFAQHVFELNSEDNRNELALMRADWIRGTVRTPKGDGISDAKVLIRTLGVARSKSLNALGSTEGCTSIARSDESGNWRAPLPYSASSRTVEVTAWHESAAQADSQVLSELVLKEPGKAANLRERTLDANWSSDSSVDLVLMPSVGIRIQFLNADSGLPITIRPTQVEVHVPQAGIVRNLFHSRVVWAADTWQRLPSDAGIRKGVYELVVPMSDLPAEKVVVLSRIPGYMPVRAIVPTVKLTELGTSIRPFEIMVPVAIGQRFVGVRTKSARPGYPELRRSAVPQLAYSARGGVGGGIVYGTQDMEGHWVFSQVPLFDELRVQLIDGLGGSNYVPVSQTSGDSESVVSLSFTWPVLCGFSPRLLNEDGERVIGARVRYNSADWPLLGGLRRTMYVHQSISRDPIELDVFGFQPTKPGIHTLFVDGPGLEFVSHEFRVEDSEVATPQVIVKFVR